MKKILKSIQFGRLHTKILITLIILLVIPMASLGYSDYQLSKKTMLEMTQNDVQTIVKKNNQIIDARLSRVREMIYGFMGDKDAYDIFLTMDNEDKVSILNADIQLKAILAKYFAQSKDIYSVQLVTSFFTFGTASSANSEHAKNFIPHEVFPETELFQAAWHGDGKTEWYPTYHFADMFQLEYLKDYDYEYKYLFSSVTLMNGSYTQSVDYRTLAEKPVLVVNFKETLFNDVFVGSLPVADTAYFVIDEGSNVVFHQDDAKVAKQMDTTMFSSSFEEESGVELMNLDGEEHVVAYSRSDITGWLSVAVIPSQKLFDPFLKRYLTNMFISAISITILFISLSFFLSRLITEPFRTMIRAIVSTGEGRFTTKLKEHGSYEFVVVMRKFNEMNEKIHKLIQENYQSEIREKEAQIKALNLQLDPHFMYNTLNMVSLMSLEKGEYEISDIVVSLSNMLKYLVRDDSALVTFEKDMMYLKSYIMIMSKRFEGAFDIEYEIDDTLYGEEVPKFFLQPLVENAFVHGFKQLSKPGWLRIQCKKEGNYSVFTVEDNGCGISEEKLRAIHSGECNVGLMNVNERIKAYYGNEYGLSIESAAGQGTKIVITLPNSQVKEAVQNVAT
ncbi:sensor histidine kinase [Paenibacillus fonticola]|uniref:sensor histidine kinase n=1 Tax=Paenibacillus fonticola TaxID=379896 RepID=UPI000373AD9E|nr:histidine kinase [Paenibacillus fonticola]